MSAPVPMFELREVSRLFPVRSGMLKRVTGHLTACDRVSFEIPENRIVGLVGESGSGKTTLGRMLVRLLDPSSGRIIYRGQDTGSLRGEAAGNFRKEVQMLFQDPFLSLNPRRTVFSTIAQPLRIHRLADSQSLKERVNGLLSLVGLEPGDGAAYPHELSGGARQRVALAAALSVEPRFIFCDEPVSALDASARAQVLNLMQDIQGERDLTLLIVSHDLTAVEYVCDEIAVMYLGGLIEHAETEELFSQASHPYTEALLGSMAERALDPAFKGEDIVLEGEIPSPVNLPSGCRFHSRCPKSLGALCAIKQPELLHTSRSHLVACHLFHEAEAVLEAETALEAETVPIMGKE